MRTAAKIISIVFHPLLMATYLVIILAKFFPVMLMIGPDHIWLTASFVFGLTFVLPVVNFLIWKYLAGISSQDLKSMKERGIPLIPYFYEVLQLKSKQERILPFIFISLMYGLVAFLFYYKFPFSSNFNKVMVIVAALVMVATVITFFYKVSVHSLALGGVVGILFPLLRFSSTLLLPFTVIIVVMGLVISARLLLDAHTPRETLIGSLAGILTGYGGLILLF